MMIYGDRERSEDAQAAKNAVANRLSEARQMPGGILRHSMLVNAFIHMSELTQGIADAEFELRGFDGPSASQHRASCALVAIAKIVDHSWRSDFEGQLEIEPTSALLSGIACRKSIRIRTCEGYAHYALYPESYLEAARRSGMDRNSFVIGIRSIGAGLGALVAAGFGALPPINLS
ncbi:hypothetical protein AB4144_14780, partial [Rhizobiaceae sp. 2RAB30]